MTICVTNNDKTIVSATRNSFTQSAASRNICVDTDRQVFGVKSSKVCVEPGKTPPQIRYERDIWSPTSLNQVVDGQTVFMLTQTAKDPENFFIMTVNGQTQRYGIDYTVTGALLTFVDDAWQMEAVDTVMLVYHY